MARGEVEVLPRDTCEKCGERLPVAAYLATIEVSENGEWRDGGGDFSFGRCTSCFLKDWAKRAEKGWGTLDSEDVIDVEPIKKEKSDVRNHRCLLITE